MPFPAVQLSDGDWLKKLPNHLEFPFQICIEFCVSGNINKPPGYTIKTLAEQFGAKPTELRALFRGQLEANRAKELQEQVLAAGLPL